MPPVHPTPTAKSVVLITGCASGIGRALAYAFHQQGLVVCATARKPDSLTELASQGILTHQLDVTDPREVQDLMHALEQQGLWVETLVNNAGYGSMGPLMDVAPQALQKQFEVNVFAPMALCQAVLPHMVARRTGRIINISSVSGVMPTPFAGAYCASKAALNALSDSLRMELAPFGIQVTTVQPGGIASGFGDAAGRTVKLKPGSPYERVLDAVLGRAQESQKDATPAAVFAAEMVRAVMSPAAPAILRIGKKSRLMPALKRWLPDRTLDRILRRKFGLDRLSKP